MIPKRIITIWLSEDETPDTVRLCNASKDRFCVENGYTHVLITLKNVPQGSDYVNKCIKNKDWVRAADYLRLHYLYQLGGIYLDADAQIIGNFDDILNSRMFVFTEGSRYINNGYIGSEPGHPFLSYVIRTMEENFRIDQNLFFAGMQFFAEAYYIADREGLGMEIYDQLSLEAKVHHFGMNSWVK